MANSEAGGAALVDVRRAVYCYVAVVVATLVALVVLSVTAPRLAPSEAWGHAVVVAVFAVLLPVRLRSASRGSRTAVAALVVIAAVLTAVNAVEATLPVFPDWMRLEMLAVAALMLVTTALAVRARARYS